MYSSGELKNLVHNKGLSQKEIILLALGCDGGGAKTTTRIKDLLANEGGLKKARKWNVAAIMAYATEFAVQVGGKWELTDKGVLKLQDLGAATKSALAAKIEDDLSSIIKNIASEDTREFLEETLFCFRHEQKRAAVVLSWVGAVHTLYLHVHGAHLTAFNAAAAARFNKPGQKANWKAAKSVEDLSDLTERNFLEVLKDISLIGKSVKLELVRRLDLRNACGHPNDFKLGKSTVAHHLEWLILNVFKKY